MRFRSVLVAVVLGAAAAALALWLVPNWLGSRFNGANRVTAIGDARIGCVSFLVALGAAATTVFAGRTYQLSREGQITDRYTKAVAQLGEVGSAKVAIRLGGIYALQRIAYDSSRDLPTVVAVLCAFVRHYGKPPPTGASADSWRQPEDVQAAITVVTRQLPRHRSDGRPIHIDLSRAHLEGADLVFAHLEGAILRDTHLNGATLALAHLERASLEGAHLEGATTIGTDLRRARLDGAHLEGVALDGRLEGASLDGTHLERANLQLSHLTREQVAQAILDDETVLPNWPR